jgi:hypothetical protein
MHRRKSVGAVIFIVVNQRCPVAAERRKTSSISPLLCGSSLAEGLTSEEPVKQDEKVTDHSHQVWSLPCRFLLIRVDLGSLLC